MLFCFISLLNPLPAKAGDAPDIDGDDSLQKKHRVLSIDGGGSILPALLFLRKLEMDTGKPTKDLFDLIVGTGTGGVIAHALTTEDPKVKGRPLFTAASLLIDLDTHKSGILKSQRGIWGYNGTKYDPTPLIAFLEERFGEARLSRALTNVATAAYETRAKETVFFKSWEAKESSDYKVSDLAIASIMDPAKFGVHRVHSISSRTFKRDTSMTLIANLRYTNPSEFANRQAKRLFGKAANLIFLSLGTGKIYRPVKTGDATRMDYKAWMARRSSLMSEDGTVHRIMLEDLGEDPDHSYFRYNPEISVEHREAEDFSKTASDHITLRVTKMFESSSKEIRGLYRLLAS